MKHSWGILDWSKLGVWKKVNEKKNPQNIHLDKSLDIHTYIYECRILHVLMNISSK